MVNTILTLGAIVLPWGLLAFGAWLFLQVVRQNGRILVRLESIEQRLGALSAAPAPAAAAEGPPSLPLGSPAPAFDLPDLDGKRFTLAQFRGRSVVLVFFGPRCGFCTQMLADLAGLCREGRKGLPMPIVITGGTVEENRPLFAPHALECPVLIQKKGEVSAAYGAFGTPTGYLIDAQGKIQSGLIAGADGLLQAARTGKAPALPSDPPAPAANGQGNGKKYGGNRPLSTSRLNRDGLKAGAAAPNFHLPRVDGGELSLEQLRGKKVLLVFSDPQCGPCDALAPQLEQVHRHTSGLQIVMVSRRDLEANRKKVAELQITFPVVLQKNWDVSMLYGMFATPIGYLIDEQGAIAADVAVGADAILALTTPSASPAANCVS